MIDGSKMRLLLLGYVRKVYGTQKEAAKHWGVAELTVSRMINGHSPISESVLDEMGYKKTHLVSYEEK